MWISAGFALNSFEKQGIGSENRAALTALEILDHLFD